MPIPRYDNRRINLVDAFCRRLIHRVLLVLKCHALGAPTLTLAMAFCYWLTTRYFAESPVTKEELLKTSNNKTAGDAESGSKQSLYYIIKKYLHTK